LRSERGKGHLSVPLAPGELVDKITILHIKAERITDAAKLRNIHFELVQLRQTQSRVCPPSEELARLTAELRSINETLWDTEDAIRLLEAAGDFGAEFIRLARTIYHQNDRRAQLKRHINELLGSRIIEEKSYANWRNGDTRMNRQANSA
jgi:hypothetical protein